MKIEIQEVRTKAQLNKFISFPHLLYKNDSNYVPALNISVKETLSTKNPFLNHSQIALFIALDNNRVVGRIAAIYNKTHLNTYKDNTGFFGFFDSINDVNVSNFLFDTCKTWLKEKGLNKVIGPTSLTTNEICGFLNFGFDLPPSVQMPYNFEYYNALALSYGFEKEIDLYSYSINGDILSEKYSNILEQRSEKLEEKDIRIRSLSKKTFHKDISKLRVVYNKCNKYNWGFMPLNEEEFNYMAKDLKMITPLDMALIAEIGNDIIGYMISVPNINQAIKHCKNGKLFPLGLFKLLWYKRRIKTSRIMILGVLEEYKGMGVDLLLYMRMKEVLNKHGIYEYEACYVLENNGNMNSIIKKVSKELLKTYRLYSLEI